MPHHHHHQLHDIQFDKLEAGNQDTVEKIKQIIREQFSRTQEPWIINGLYDYYLNTNSARSMEILMTLREPHHQFLFDRLCDTVKSSKSDLKSRVQALTLLGHIASNQPIWLNALPEHPLFKEILRFLLSETELLPLISALLVLIVLLPMYPSYIGAHYLDDIFDIFKRLAAWNSHVPGKLGEDQMIHLQVALYALFLRLYGMYPCNFLAYLRSQFMDRNNPVFCHTIKPMMDTVKMHPSLVTTSKENETTTERWKKMAVHDVIVECERFSLDIPDRCPHDTCQNTTEFRSRSGTMNSTVGSSTTTESSYHQQHLRALSSLHHMGAEEQFFSPSQSSHYQAVTITESSGIAHRQIQGLISFQLSQDGSPPEAAIEATPETTPIRDFTTPTPVASTKSSVARALTSFRTNSSGYVISGTPTNSLPSSPMRKEPSPFVYPAPSTLSQHLAYKLSQDRQNVDSVKPPPSSSPLRILTGENRFVDAFNPEEDDEEVSSISGRAEAKRSIVKNYELDHEECLQHSKDADEVEHGSPCTAGGLHMPNSRSLNSFKKRIGRIRYYSQCNPEPERVECSTESSPGNGLVAFGGNVRRANSCPDIKKERHCPVKDRKPFCETDEDLSEDQTNGIDLRKLKLVKVSSSATQTELFWPMPYEHLFFNIFPSLKEDTSLMDIKPSPAPSPAPVLHQEPYKPSLYDILDKYIENSVMATSDSSWREQIQLIHQQFLFERHRRETHAYRNRRLLSDAKNTRLLEECNSALRDQVQLEQKEIDDLRGQLERERTNIEIEHQGIKRLKDKCQTLTDENSILKEINRKLETDMGIFKVKLLSLDKGKQLAEAALVDALADGKIAKEQVLAEEKIKKQLQRVNRELLLMGELHVKYREKLDKLTNVKQNDEEMRQLSEAYREELKGLQHKLDAKSTIVDACRARIGDIEHTLSGKDEIIARQKRTLMAINEERAAALESIESKYQTQLAINRTLEEVLLGLRHKLETETARRRTHSPDTSSCHEAQTSSSQTAAAAGLSPQHSSPLSVSLASSSDNSSAVTHELKQLQQMYVDQEVDGGSKFEETG